MEYRPTDIFTSNAQVPQLELILFINAERILNIQYSIYAPINVSFHRILQAFWHTWIIINS